MSQQWLQQSLLRSSLKQKREMNLRSSLKSQINPMNQSLVSKQQLRDELNSPTKVEMLRNLLKTTKLFFNMVIHDMRNPTTSIKAGLESSIQYHEEIKKLLGRQKSVHSKITGFMKDVEEAKVEVQFDTDRFIDDAYSIIDKATSKIEFLEKQLQTHLHGHQEFWEDPPQIIEPDYFDIEQCQIDENEDQVPIMEQKLLP